MKIGIVLGGLALAGIALMAAVPRPVQDNGPDLAAMQELMLKAMTPGEEHAGLARTVGSWKLELKIAAMGPDMPMVTMHATSEIEAVLGGRYFIEEIVGEFMGQPFLGISITGYDNMTGTFDNVWMDNQGTAMTFMKGKGDADSAIVWRGIKNDPVLGEIAVRSVQKMTADGMTFESFDTIDGQESKQLEITYTRAGLSTDR